MTSHIIIDNIRFLNEQRKLQDIAINILIFNNNKNYAAMLKRSHAILKITMCCIYIFVIYCVYIFIIYMFYVYILYRFFCSLTFED